MGPRSTTPRSILVVRDLLGVALLSVCLFLASELALRGVRALRGEPTRTEMETVRTRLGEAMSLYRRHPFLNTGPRSSVSGEAFGRRVTFNSLGYRSPERPREKPPGVYRIVCAGGSTTFDLAADRDDATWPWMLEELLSGPERPVEVWNAGFPGWTSLENAISFVQRDASLEPDLVILYQGINDLQPASHAPFDPGYEAGHALLARQSLGLEGTALGWAHRSLLVESVRSRLFGKTDPWRALTGSGAQGPRSSRIPDEAVRAFTRNVRALVAMSTDRGASVLLVPQKLVGDRPQDLEYLRGWIPGLDPGRAAHELERFNEALVVVGLVGPDVRLMESPPWRPGHFVDPMHTSEAGSELLASAIAAEVRPILEARVAAAQAGAPTRAAVEATR